MCKMRIAYNVDSHFPAIDRKRERKKGWREKVEELTGLISAAAAAAPTESPQSPNSAMGKNVMHLGGEQGADGDNGVCHRKGLV